MKCNFKKVLFGLLVSLVLAMAIGSFAIGEAQTPANPQVETRGAVNAPASGAFTITATDGETVLTDNDYSYASGILTIKSATPMTIKNTNTGSTTDRIKVEGAATITLAGVNIEATTGAALEIKDDATFNVNITLADDSENTLTATSDNYAGLQKNGDSGVGMLTITGSTGEKAGKLTAIGGSSGAGIGGGGNGNGSDIYVNDGDIESTGGGGAAGVGGGMFGNGNNIEATGGILKATGGLFIDEGTGEKHPGAGIGGGAGGTGSNNTINGDAIVVAESGDADKDPLEGTDVKRGIVFTRKGNSGTYEGTVQGTVTLPGDFELPVPSTLRVPSGSKIIIPEGKTLTVPKDGTLEVEEGGEVENNGTINNKGSVKNNGTLTNNGTINNEDGATIDNKGKFNNRGTVNNKKGGTINNQKPGEIENTGAINNNGDINNEEGSKIDNKGDINNGEDGKINNRGEIDNYGNITNKGIINNENGGNINNKDHGKIDNFGIIQGGGAINYDGDSKFTVFVTYDPCGGTVSPTSEEKVYRDKDGVKTYETLPTPVRAGYRFEGWYTEATGGTQVTESTPVIENSHTLFAHWKDLSENADSSKTGDSFAGVAALALLGVATTGAVLVRKRK